MGIDIGTNCMAKRLQPPGLTFISLLLVVMSLTSCQARASELRDEPTEHSHAPHSGVDLPPLVESTAPVVVDHALDASPSSDPAVDTASDSSLSDAELPDAGLPVEQLIPPSAVQSPPQGLIDADNKIEEKLEQQVFSLLDEDVPARTSATLYWSPQNLFDGLPLPTPVLVVNGAYQGPTVCLTGAIHGDEINSIETIRQIMHNLDTDKLSGTVVGVPIVNQMGFRRGSRYLPDRRDLNRFFPGDPKGSSASRIAYSLFEQVIRHCDALVDLHTGSFHRTNIPQLRANLTDAAVTDIVKGFGDMVVLHSEGSPGMLRYEAVRAGIPAVTLEAGESMRIQEDVVEVGVEQINALLINLGMVKKPFFWSDSRPVFLSSSWIRANSGGIFISRIELGDKIEEGDLLGYISDPITNKRFDVKAELSGKVIGMAVNQVVLPGYAIYHVGIDSSRLETPQLSANEVSDWLLSAKKGEEAALSSTGE